MVRRSPLAFVAYFIRMRIAAARQTAVQTFHRLPGDRMLSGPSPAAADAQEEWQFALLSVAAYGRSNPKAPPLPAGNGMVGSVRYALAPAKGAPDEPNVDAKLEELGWTRWSEFPDATLVTEMHESHLRAEVWSHEAGGKVVVAFGGTVFTSGKDWKSNLRWFWPKHNDEYTTIVKRFGPDFVKEFYLRMNTPAGAYLRDARIYVTGHSLGGGLAQQFAYAMPREPAIQKVEQVYAFDPSPVTGFFSVEQGLRDYNKEGLKITRSYERGEVLALLRSFTSVLVKPTARDAEIRGVRFNLFHSQNALAGHSMVELADRMQAVAKGAPMPAPPAARR